MDKLELGNNKRAATRDALLTAAKHVVARDGVARLTLDTVAHQAGVSKGGVLYHFPTKNALIAAMMEDDIASWKAEVAACEKREAEIGQLPQAGRHVRAFVSAASDMCPCGARSTALKQGGDEDTTEWFATAPDLRAGMIAAIAGDHGLLKRFRDEFDFWQNRFENDGIDPTTATLVRLAVDGLIFVDMLGLAPPTGALREKIVAQLLDLATPKEIDNTV